MRRFHLAFVLATAPLLAGLAFAQQREVQPRRRGQTQPAQNQVTQNQTGRTQATASRVRLSDVPTIRQVPRRGQAPAPRVGGGVKTSVSGSRTQTRNVEANNRGVFTTVSISPATIEWRPAQRRWELGVGFEAAPMGVRVTSVLNGGPAQRMLGYDLQGQETNVQINPGDYIVDINGHPVGFCPTKQVWVDFSALLSDQANNPLDPNDFGWVNLGVFDMQTHQTMSFWVQLQQR